MPITIDGAGTISGLSTGGLPNGSVVQADLASGVAGTGPAFEATKTTLQSGLALATYHKVTFTTEQFDTASNYDTTLSRFTPNVAGYYQLNWAVQAGGSTNTTGMLSVLYKDGSLFRYGSYYNGATAYPISNFISSGSALIYMDGSSDYLEIYAYVTGTGTASIQALGHFSASLVRAA